MKKFLFIYFLFNLVIFGIDAEYLYQKGNEHYRNSKYDEALVCYKSILDANYESAELYYNLANVYYKLNKIGYAILYYEKALKLSPNDEDIKYNLSLAQLQTIDKINPLPKVWLWEIYENYLNIFHLNTWAILTLLFLITAVASGLIFIFYQNFLIQKYSFIAAIIFTILFIATALSTLGKYNLEMSEIYGIVLENSVIVKTSPDEKSSDAFILHEGTKAKLVDQIGDWNLIKLLDGKTGWIPVKAFGKI